MKIVFKKSKKAYLSLFVVFYVLSSYSQEAQKDTVKINALNEVIVSSVRAKDKNPIP
ncbi:MAG: hypothetical protein RL259_1726, partial [Bacteroidota bacterium]